MVDSLALTRLCLTIIVVASFLFVSESVKAQSISDKTWLIDKQILIRNDGSEVVVFERVDQEHYIDLSKASLTFNNDNTYIGKNLAGVDISGSYIATETTLSLNGDSTDDFEQTSPNHFNVRTNVQMPNASFILEDVVSVSYYISELVLPVILQSFNVEQHGKTGILSWKSSEEENFSHFEIEKSINGELFDKIGETNSSGSNSSYNFEDEEAFAQRSTVFYRLKMIDHDNSFNYSEVKSISTNREDVQVFPNPTQSIVNYRQIASNTGTYKVISLSGRTLISGEVQDSGIVDLASLPKGVYHLLFLQGKKAIHSERIVKL